MFPFFQFLFEFELWEKKNSFSSKNRKSWKMCDCDSWLDLTCIRLYMSVCMFMCVVCWRKKKNNFCSCFALARANAGTRFFEVKATVRVMHTRLLSLYIYI